MNPDILIFGGLGVATMAGLFLFLGRTPRRGDARLPAPPAPRLPVTTTTTGTLKTYSRAKDSARRNSPPAYSPRRSDYDCADAHATIASFDSWSAPSGPDYTGTPSPYSGGGGDFGGGGSSGSWDSGSSYSSDSSSSSSDSGGSCGGGGD